MSPSITKPRVLRSPDERLAIGDDDDPYARPCAARAMASGTVAYAADADDRYWLAHVKWSFRLEPRPGGWAYVGDCPRCCHPIDGPLVKVREGTAAEVAITLACGCGVAHPEAPRGWRGCGGSGHIVFEVPWAADAWKRGTS